ncbi:MAG: DUF72 domain-containing protein [Candidatus Krumholzibacteriia bacterium]
MSHQPSFFDPQPPSGRGDALVRFGTSSFSAPEWLGTFYPRGTKPGDFLRYYATQFDTVEVDATYYHIPAPGTVDSWVCKTPGDFSLAAKFPRSIVHAGETTDPDSTRVLLPDATYADRDAFLEVMSRLGARLGPLVLQFPHFPRECFASPAQFLERLDRFLEDLPEGFCYCVEIRNRTWIDARFASVCRRHGVAMVLVDRVHMPHADEIMRQLDPVTGSFAYVRLLGDRRRIEAITARWDREVIDRRSSLERWAQVLVRLSERAVPTFVYANNHYAGHAPTTVRRLHQMYTQAIDRRAR